MNEPAINNDGLAAAEKVARPLAALLISTYELGHQPFGLASPAAWLRALGADVTCVDTAIDELPASAVRDAELVAVYLPMHTATRLAVPLIGRVRTLNPAAHLCCYGLYAPVNEQFLRSLGAQTVIGGEFEQSLCSLALRLAGRPRELGLVAAAQPQPEPVISLPRLRFRTPDRSELPALRHYAHLDTGDGHRKVVGYTEATRGCKHLCRHCPVVPVYNGRFRVVQREVVLGDIRRQVAAGAQHITFGDPDFLNGPAHGFALVQALHEEFPQLSYDCTIKIEHLVRYRQRLPVLRDTGCLFVTTAVESVDPRVLEYFDKRHTREQFVDTVRHFRELGLTMNPTFVTFSPWTTPHGYLELLALLAELDLVDGVAPIQYAIRLLVPRGSRLLELDEVRRLVGEFDEQRLCYPWRHPDPRMDRLHGQVMAAVTQAQRAGEDRRATFVRVWALASALVHGAATPAPAGPRPAGPQRPVPSMSEPWYCCAEPSEEQLAPFV